MINFSGHFLITPNSLLLLLLLLLLFWVSKMRARSRILGGVVSGPFLM